MTYKTKEECAKYAREWRAKHREEVREADRARVKAVTQDPEKREKRRQYRQQYRVANPWVKDRDAATNKVWVEQNRERIAKNQQERRAKDPEKYREYNARWHRENRANNPAKVRDMHLRSIYGLTQVQYDAMLVLQSGGCAICEKPPDGEKYGVLHVDHCHTTGVVRGLLCHGCNTGSGMADNIELLEKKIAYLKRTPPETFTTS